MLDRTEPFTFSQPSSIVSNSDFLNTLCPILPPGTHFWATSFAKDPANCGAAVWTGYPLTRHPITGLVPVTNDPQANNYYTVSVFIKGADGVVARKKELFAGQFVLVIDDVGVEDLDAGIKVDWGRFIDFPDPTFVLETSPGNHHVGWALELVLDREYMETVLQAILHDKLGLEDDPGCKNVTRYLRLPIGWNNKAKYGSPFPIQLVHWAPANRYQLPDLVARWNLDLTRHQGCVQRSCESSSFEGEAREDPFYRALEAAGSILGPVTDKGGFRKVDIVCPWVDEHTDRSTSGTMYVLGGGYECHHGHCRDRNFGHVRAAVLEGRLGDAARQILVQADAYQAFGSVVARMAEQEHTGVVLPDLAPPPQPGGDPTFDELAAALAQFDKSTVSETAESRMQVTQLIGDIKRSTALNAYERATLWDKVPEHTGLKQKAVTEIAKEATQGKTKRKEKKERKWTGRAEDGSVFVADSDWVRVDGEGNPINVVGNVEVVARAAGLVPYYNEMTREIEFEGDNAGMLRNVAYERLLDHCRCNYFTPKRDDIRGAMLALAHENARHPFEEYLRYLPRWDGYERISGPYGLISAMNMEQDEDFTNLCLRRWLYSVVALAFNQHTEQFVPRSVLTFVGAQYVGKTTWLRSLFPVKGAFKEGLSFADDKDTRFNALSTMCAEFGEIDSSLNRVEQGKFKSFLSTYSITDRRPYEASHETLIRRTAWCASVNYVGFLKDLSGNTRFLPMKVRDNEYLDSGRLQELGIEQIWAQIVVEYEAGMQQWRNRQVALPPWVFTREEMDRINAHNEHFRERTAEELALIDAFAWNDPRYVNAIDKFEVNPLTSTQLQVILEPGKASRQLGKDWIKAIRALTKRERPKNDGKRRIWPMPLLREDAAKRPHLYVVPPTEPSPEDEEPES